MNTSIHTKDCGYHVDQYSWECDCGAIKHEKHPAFKEKLKLYSIKFNGYWPVGAVAIVQATSKAVAIKLFQDHLSVHHPTLVADNNGMYEDKIEEIDLSKDHVNILLDGNY
jgi:hypothetical protein